MLSAFSTVAGDQAADLEDFAARGLLQEALPIVEQLAQCANSSGWQMDSRSKFFGSRRGLPTPAERMELPMRPLTLRRRSTSGGDSL
jgi:hypothetical protein